LRKTSNFPRGTWLTRLCSLALEQRACPATARSLALLMSINIDIILYYANNILRYEDASYASANRLAAAP
jgi:hypothetical protein